MVLIVIFIAVTLLTAIVLGPVALIRANAAIQLAKSRHDLLNGRIDRLAAQLTKLQLRLGALEPDRRQSANESSTATVEADDSIAAQEPAFTQAQAPAEPDEAPITAPIEPEPMTMNTLEALRAARQRMQAPTTSPHEPVQPGPSKSQSNEPESIAVSISASTDASTINDWNDSEPANPQTERQAIDDTDHQPARRLSLEEVLAGRVFVWIGAVALVLTAAFLLKLGFDRGIITEPVRVIGAGVFGLALWCIGEWMRGRASLIAQALCGAAVAVLYATVLAGHSLYHLIGTPWAFGLMAAITTAAVLLSLRHGPAVALLGMVGGFMLPPVLGESFRDATAGMVLYLLALEIGILTITGRRGWFGLSALTLLFTIIWSLGYVLFGDSPGERTLTAMLIVGTAVAYLVQTARVHRDPNADPHSIRWMIGLSIAAVCSASVVVALLVPQGGFSPREFYMLGLVAAGTIVLARLDRRYLALPFATMGLSLLVLLASALAHHAPAVFDINRPSLSTIFTSTIAYGSLYLIGGYLCLWGSTHKRIFTLMSVIAGPAYYAVILIASEGTFGDRSYWWPYTLMLAGVYALGLFPLLRRRIAEHDAPSAMLAVMSFALVCVAIVQGLDHPRIAVCLALVSAVAALIDRRLFIRPLLIAGTAVASLAAVLLVVPGPFTVDIQGMIVFNTLLPMYVLPALGFGLIAWCARQTGEQRITNAMACLTVGTLSVMLVALTRNAFEPHDFAAESFDLYEWASYACLLMLGALSGLAIAKRYALDAVRRAWVWVASIGAAIGFIGALIPGNPLLRTQPIDGVPLTTGLIGLYLLPAALMWLWSRRRAIDNHPALRSTLRVLAITLIAMFAGLQVRHAFHPDDLQALTVGMFECATHAAVWMLLGLAIQGVSLLNPQWPATRTAGRTVFAIGLTTALIGNVVVLNPLWNSGSVGDLPVINGLWYLLGPSILALALLAQRCRATDQQLLARLAGFSAIAIGFLLTSLLVRQGFSVDGILLLDGRPSSAERYAYSLAWVLLGALLIVAGVLTKLDTLRYGSLAIMLIAVGKVFLIDTASLDNLYRVFSFFGLGVTLIALGYLYQRLIFRRPNPLTTNPLKKGMATP